jgi:hypothetical protein
MTEPQPSETAPDVEPGKENIGKLVGFLLLAVIVVGFVIAASNSRPQPASGGVIYDNPTNSHLVTYQVQGIGNVDITIENETGSTEQHTVKLPWKREFTAPSGQAVVLLAQKSGQAGNITCILLFDGRVEKKAEASSEYGICDVSGLVP